MRSAERKARNHAGTSVFRSDTYFEGLPDHKKVRELAVQKAKSRSASEWAKAVMARDGMTCQVCGSHDDLHAHHIFSQRKFPGLRRHIDNGITLCAPCHSKWHALKRQDEKQAGDQEAIGALVRS